MAATLPEEADRGRPPGIDELIGTGFRSWDPGEGKVSLDGYKGKPVLLTFWATWCTTSQEELPALQQQIEDRYSSSGLTVLVVDYRETDTARMSRFLAGLHVDMEAVAAAAQVAASR